MAKVCPQSLVSSSSSSSSSSSEMFTLWMKSLVMSGNGCTVYNSKGQLAYRVDNYACKCSDGVYLMDRKGETLAKISRNKMRVFGGWNGYRCDGSTSEDRRPWFSVQKAGGKLYEYMATVGVGSGSANPSCYKIVGLAHKSEYKIMDIAGEPVAEVKRKHTTSGVALGDDVLTLEVERNVDILLIMGIVIVCGLINNSM